MKQHTPGPWVTDRTANGEIGFWEARTGFNLLHSESNIPVGERERNARLMAAAPDLLSSLEEALFWVKKGASESTLQKALYAIAKVRG